MKITKQKHNDKAVLNKDVFMYCIEGKNSLTGDFVSHFLSTDYLTDKESMQVAIKHFKDMGYAGQDSIASVYLIVGDLPTYKVEQAD